MHLYFKWMCIINTLDICRIFLSIYEFSENFLFEFDETEASVLIWIFTCTSDLL